MRGGCGSGRSYDHHNHVDVTSHLYEKYVMVCEQVSGAIFEWLYPAIVTGG